MIGLISDQLLLFMVVSVVSYVFQRLALARVITTGIVDYFVPSNAGIAFGMGVCAAMAASHMAPAAEVMMVLSIYLFFWAGVLLGGFMLPWEDEKMSLPGFLPPSAREWWERGVTLPPFRVTFLIAGAVLVIYKGMFGYMLLSYPSGDYRLLLAKLWRPLDILLGGIEMSWLVLVLVILFLGKGRWSEWVLGLTYVVTSFFSGSKGGLLGVLLLVVLIYVMFVGRRIPLKFQLAALMIGGLSVVLIKSFWSRRWDFWGALDRLVASGDVYLISFFLGNYQDVVGRYHPLEYIFHPFSAIFGVRAYAYPVGSMLGASIPGRTPSVFGPNPQLPILLPVLLGPESLLSLPVAMLLGVAVPCFMWFGHTAMTRRINHFWASGLFSAFYLNALTIFTDFSLFEINVIKAMLGAGVLFFINIGVARVLRFNPN